MVRPFHPLTLTWTGTLVLNLVVAARDWEVVGVVALQTSVRCAGENLSTAVVLNTIHRLAFHLSDGAARTE